MKTTISITQGNRWPGQDSNRAPPEYDSTALPLCQPARCCGSHEAVGQSLGQRDGFGFSLHEPGANRGQLGHCVLQSARNVTTVRRAEKPNTAYQHNSERGRFHCYVIKENRTERHAPCMGKREVYTEFG
jgi:hypothetical protein